MGIFNRKKRTDTAGLCSLIVVAAGSSSRMGTDKIMMDLCGVPVILHSITTFNRLPEVGEIIVVTREALISPIAELCRFHRLEKVKKVICGGASRLESSRLGTLEVSREARLIAIHDGARPLVTEEVAQAAIRRAMETGAAAPAIQLKDTVKEVEGNLVSKTLDRACLRAVQTPQVFDASLICAALQSALDDRAEITDDCSAVERIGMKVSLTPGSESNIKLTTPFDLVLAESLLMEGKVR